MTDEPVSYINDTNRIKYMQELRDPYGVNTNVFERVMTL